jgi:hypothetical protein
MVPVLGKGGLPCHNRINRPEHRTIWSVNRHHKKSPCFRSQTKFALKACFGTGSRAIISEIPGINGNAPFGGTNNILEYYYDCKGCDKSILYEFERRNIIQYFALVYLFGSSFKPFANETHLLIDGQRLYVIS